MPRIRLPIGEAERAVVILLDCAMLPDPRYPVGMPEDLRRQAEQAVPFALDLAGCPIILPYRVQAKPRDDGGLPLSRVRAIRDWELPNGTVGRIETTGHPLQGLPFGSDADFLVAAMKALEESGATDGRLTGLTLREVARTFGADYGGTRGDQYKASALRLAHVRIQTDVLYRPEQMDLDEWMDEYLFLEIDRTDPRLRLLETQTLHIFHLMTSRPILEDTGAPAGDFLIREILFHPLWAAQINSGWSAWLDMDTYRSLPKGMVRRLYLFLAHLASAEWQRKRLWRVREHELFSVLGYPREEWGRAARRYLKPNLQLLIDSGVLAGGELEWEGSAHRGIVYKLQPGRALSPTVNLAGLPGIARSPVRALVIQLRHWNVDDDTISRWVREDFGRLSYAIARVNYLRDPRHSEGRTVNNPGAFIRKAIEEDYNFQADPGFRRWLEYDGEPPDLPPEIRPTSPAVRPAQPPSPVPPASPAVRGGQPVPPTPFPAQAPSLPAAASSPPGTEDACACYGQVLQGLKDCGEASSIMATIVLKGSDPLRIDDDTLVLRTTEGLARIGPQVSQVFERILRSLDSPVSQLKLLTDD